jgi:hypothetical protein
MEVPQNQEQTSIVDILKEMWSQDSIVAHLSSRPADGESLESMQSLLFD